MKADEPMQASLELSGHPKANVQRVVLSGTTLVGRSRDCGLQIASASVSRKHCEIRLNDDNVSVIDLGSSNGTYINSERLPAGEERVISSGSRLNIGGVRFLVQYETADAGADIAPALAAGGVAAAVAVDEPFDAEVATDAEDAIVPDEAIIAEEPVLAEEPILSEEISLADDAVLADDEPILAEDEAVLADDVPMSDEIALEESIEGEVAPGDDAAIADAAEGEPVATASPASDLIDPLDEPDLMDLFADESGDDGTSGFEADAAVEEGSAGKPTAGAAGQDEEEPILEVDEDQAFAFLTDDDSADEPTRTEDSQLGDFLGKLSRD